MFRLGVLLRLFADKGDCFATMIDRADYSVELPLFRVSVL